MVLGYGLALPFLGTALGAGCVFFMKRALPDGVQRALGTDLLYSAIGVSLMPAHPRRDSGHAADDALPRA